MSTPHVSRRLVKWIYRIVRVFVRLVVVLVLLGLVAFIYLRLQGVPGPLLRKAMHRANVAGIPVEVESIILTLRGWRADNVRYYSGHPDDLEPIFKARTVFFSMQRKDSRKPRPAGVNIEVKAVGVEMAPSVEWGVAIPESSGSRQVDQIEAVLGFRSDRIVLSDGKMKWLGSVFKVNGTVLKRTGAVRPPPTGVQPPVRQATVLPVFVTSEQFRGLEDRLKMLSLPSGASVEIDFEIDTANYAASWMNFTAQAEDLAYRNVGFSKAEVVGGYAYPAFQLERAALFQDKQSIQLAGEYYFDSKQAKGTLYNSITSNRLLLLAPAKLLELLTRIELQVGSLPRLEVNFGPAMAKDLLNHVSGVFSIRDVTYQGIEIESLRGQLKRSNNRSELTHLQAAVNGQESRSEEAGSAMQGGTAEGEVFWDQNTREFGVKADVALDPNLLVRPLSPVRIATNVIQYFSFKNQAPHGHVELGAMVDDWSTFYIDIQAVGNDVAFRGVDFSSVNATAAYRHGTLKLAPIAVVQGADFAKGAVELDFRNDTVSFDAQSSLDPADLEDMIYPTFNFFGEKIKTEGNVRLSAQGLIDWGTMKQTAFSATVSAETLEIPVGIAKNFQAEVVGDGSLLSIQNAVFSLYEGDGNGHFQIQLDPETETMPYEFDASFSAVDLKQFVEFYAPEEVQVSGALSANAHIEADMSTNFFSVANGNVRVKVDEGQLADLPFFKGFTKVVRVIIPGFNAFSITSLSGDYSLTNGVISTQNAVFNGDIISASGHGEYHPDSGFDARVQTHILSRTGFSKVVRLITDPLMKFFEMKLTGPLSDPSWRLEKLP